MHSQVKRRVVVLCGRDGARPTRLDQLKDLVEITYCDEMSLRSALPGTDALFLWHAFSTALEDAWTAADSLQWVHTASAGVDTILFPAFRKSSVALTNARGIFDRPIAEYVLSAILAVQKQWRRTYELQGTRAWEHRQFANLRGSNALVVGTGSIGREVARVLRALDLQVRGLGRTARASDPDFGTVFASSALPEHVAWADHIVVAAPLTASTRGMFDAEAFASMRETAHLINVGRGELVVEDALIRALRAGQLGHATLDVFEHEPLGVGSPLWDMPHVTITAHLSGDTLGWNERVTSQFVENTRRWATGRPLMNLIDKKAGYSVQANGS